MNTRKSKMVGGMGPGQDHWTGLLRPCSGVLPLGPSPPAPLGMICAVSWREPGLPSTADMPWATWGGVLPHREVALPSLPSVSAEMDGSIVSDVADAGDTPWVICLVLI